MWETMMAPHGQRGVGREEEAERDVHHTWNTLFSLPPITFPTLESGFCSSWVFWGRLINLPNSRADSADLKCYWLLKLNRASGRDLGNEDSKNIISKVKCLLDSTWNNRRQILCKIWQKIAWGFIFLKGCFFLPSLFYFE